jgi:hypothetical protein
MRRHHFFLIPGSLESTPGVLIELPSASGRRMDDPTSLGLP